MTQRRRCYPSISSQFCHEMSCSEPHRVSQAEVEAEEADNATHNEVLDDCIAQAGNKVKGGLCVCVSYLPFLYLQLLMLMGFVC